MKIREKRCIRSFIDILIRIWCDQAGMRLRCHQCTFCSTWIFRFCTGRFLANNKKLSLHYNRDRMGRIDHRICIRPLRIDNKHRILTPRDEKFSGLVGTKLSQKCDFWFFSIFSPPELRNITKFYTHLLDPFIQGLIALKSSCAAPPLILSLFTKLDWDYLLTRFFHRFWSEMSENWLKKQFC